MIIDAVLQNKNTKKQIYKYAVCSLSGTYCLNDPTLSGEISRISCGSRWPFCKLEPTQLSTQLSCLLSNEMYITSQPLISSACLACRIFWFPPAECCSGGCRRPNFRRAAVFQKPLAVHQLSGTTESVWDSGKWTWVKKLLFETEKIWKNHPSILNEKVDEKSALCFRPHLMPSTKIAEQWPNDHPILRFETLVE